MRAHGLRSSLLATLLLFAGGDLAEAGRGGQRNARNAHPTTSKRVDPKSLSGTTGMRIGGAPGGRHQLKLQRGALLRAARNIVSFHGNTAIGAKVRAALATRTPTGRLGKRAMRQLHEALLEYAAVRRANPVEAFYNARLVLEASTAPAPDLVVEAAEIAADAYVQLLADNAGHIERMLLADAAYRAPRLDADYRQYMRDLGAKQLPWPRAKLDAIGAGRARLERAFAQLAELEASEASLAPAVLARP